MLTWRRTAPGTLTCVEFPEYAITWTPENKKRPFTLRLYCGNARMHMCLMIAKTDAENEVRELLEMGVLEREPC